MRKNDLPHKTIHSYLQERPLNPFEEVAQRLRSPMLATPYQKLRSEQQLICSKPWKVKKKERSPKSCVNIHINSPRYRIAATPLQQHCPRAPRGGSSCCTPRLRFDLERAGECGTGNSRLAPWPWHWVDSSWISWSSLEVRIFLLRWYRAPN